MEWVRGAMLGKGSFGFVNLAAPLCKSNLHTPPIMAVKSAVLSKSSSLQREEEILSQLQDCTQILHCFGHDTTNEHGNTLYNLFLEYVPGGTLADRVRQSATGRLPESDVRRYARSILKGLDYMHRKGYVHCDIKLENVLVCLDGDVKIADFGLARKSGERTDDGMLLRGTPLYMAPEAVARNEYEAPSDVWAMGCAVAEMVTGKPALKCEENADILSVLYRIGFRGDSPEIPWELSEEGRDFLGKCFVSDPKERWTVEMLLNHPFVMIDGDDDVVLDGMVTPSPRSAIDFHQWQRSVQSSMPSLCSSSSDSDFEEELEQLRSSSSTPLNRVRQLVSDLQPNWSSWGDNWIFVRGEDCSVSPSAEEEAKGEDSMVILEQMVKGDAEREEKLNSLQREKEGTSTSASWFQQCEFNGYDCMGRSIDVIENSTDEFTFRNRTDGNSELFQHTTMNGSDFSLFSSSCNSFDTSISDEYK